MTRDMTKRSDHSEGGMTQERMSHSKNVEVVPRAEGRLARNEAQF